jgi:hypothetical protein
LPNHGKQYWFGPCARGWFSVFCRPGAWKTWKRIPQPRTTRALRP